MSHNEKRRSKPKGVQVTVRLTEEQAKELRELAEVLRCPAPEVLRRGLGPMRQVAIAVRAGIEDDRMLEGDELTVEAKQKFLAATRMRKGAALAANEAGVTLRTVNIWCSRDDVFRRMAEEAQAVGIDEVEQWLLAIAQDAKSKGAVTAILAFLNNRHPDYGMIRTQLLQRVLGPLLDRVIKIASRFLPTADLQRFAVEVGRETELVALEASNGGRAR